MGDKKQMTKISRKATLQKTLTLLRLSLELQRRLNAKCLEQRTGSDSVIADDLIRIFTWSHPCCAKSSVKHRATLPHAAVMSDAFLHAKSYRLACVSGFFSDQLDNWCGLIVHR